MSLNEKLQFYIDFVGADAMSRKFNELNAQAQELQKNLTLNINPKTGKEYASGTYGKKMLEHASLQQGMLSEAEIAYNRQNNFGINSKNWIKYNTDSRNALINEARAGIAEGKAELEAEIAASQQRMQERAEHEKQITSYIADHQKKREQLIKEAQAGVKEGQKELDADLKASEKKRHAESKAELKKHAKETKEINDQIANHFKTGFSFHILQMYALPVLRAVNRMAKQTLTVFSEFDQKFADYVAKSEEYASHISRADFYKIVAGQSYSLSDAADVAERFAASGIDVAESQLALQRALEVSKISGLAYKDATNGVIRTMQAMHLSIDDVTYITDSMVNAANASTAELKDMVGWFEYAASAAYNAGMNVQQLSAMLGILSSTGMPNAGTAIRQMFMQFSKEDVRQKFKERFSWITDDMFHDMDSLVSGLRDYVQQSDDMTKAAREVTTLIGGKVTAQQSLNNLLVAEPHLWDQVRSAVTKTGTTADLYAKVTDNAADAMLRMRNSMQLMMAQIGEFLYPTLKIMDKILQTVVQVVSATPGPLKQLAGAFLFLGSIVSSLAFGFMTLVGGMSIVQGVTLLLKTQMGAGAITAGGYKMALKALWAELVRVGGASNIAASSTQRLSLSFKGLTAAVSGLMGGMLGYYAAQHAVDNHMLTEARLVGHLTSLWVAYSAAKTVGLVTPWGALAGAGAFSASELLIQSKISEWEREQRMARQRNMLGGGTTYQVSMYDTVISNDGGSDFASELNRVLGV